MPLYIQDNVPCSEMRGSNLHQGPRTAGNKSMLTYRSDIGIPGYTGYTPGWATVPVPINGSNQHTGRVVDEVTQTNATLEATQQRRSASEYKQQYASHAAHCSPPTKTGGGYWYLERSRQAATSSSPFLGRTQYQADLLEGPATAEKALASSSGVATTLVGYQAGRAKSSSAAQRGSLSGAAPPLSATTAVTSSGHLLGYTTTYASACEPLTRAMGSSCSLNGSGSEEGGARPATCDGQVETRRFERLPAATPPRMSEATTYKRDFGALAQDPLRHATTQPRQQKLCATTKPINAGTTRACQHVPGYTGFVPATEAHVAATAAGESFGEEGRQSIKAAMLPVNLDQYSRSRLAHYTGYKPRQGGLSVVQPAQGPTDQTTQGFVDTQIAALGPQARETAHCINSRTGLMTFFTGGVESVSENGLSDAQKFFVRLRPLEGRFKTGITSKTTSGGAKFSAGSSLVPP